MPKKPAAKQAPKTTAKPTVKSTPSKPKPSAKPAPPQTPTAKPEPTTPQTSPKPPAPKVSKTIHDTGLIASIAYLKENNLLPENKSKIVFETVKEAEDSSKEDVVSLINETLNTLKQDISELQKKGYKIKLTGISLLPIPLKTKIWLATTAKKDLINIYQIINDAKMVIDPLKADLEKKEIENEERLKKREEALKSEKERQQAESKAILNMGSKKVTSPLTKPAPTKPQISKEKIGNPLISTKKKTTS